MGATPKSEAAEAFFDHAGIDPEKGPEELLHLFTGAFATVPYENLTKYLNCSDDAPRVLRMPETVVREHISAGTGGTCFSLTETAREIVSSRGIRARPVMADMQHGPSIHCAVLAELPGGKRYLVDPGYLVPEPVPLEEGSITRIDCGAESLEYRPAGGDSWDMFTVTERGSSWRYRIRLTPVTDIEFLESWTRSFDAPGMNSLHINMRESGTRLYAHNLNLRITDSGGGRNEKLRDGYAERVHEIFGISRKVAAMAIEEMERRRCRQGG